MKCFELVLELEKLMRVAGKGGQPVILQIDHGYGGDFEIKGVRWVEDAEHFEIEG